VDHEIVFWHALGGPLGDALMEMIYQFNREHPDIRIRAISMGNYAALSQKLMASIQAGNQPDIAQVFESWTANLVRGGVLLALDNLIDEDPVFRASLTEDFFPVFIESVTLDGKIWSFPFNKSVRVMYYNKDTFFRNDVDWTSPPRTWEEYLTLCKLFTYDRPGRLRQLGTSFHTDMLRFQNLLLQAGGEMMNEDLTRPMFNSPEGLEALNFFVRLLHVDQSAEYVSGHEAQNRFLAQNIAFFEGSSVSYVFMRNTEILFNLGITAVPTFRNERNVISGTNIAIFDKGNDEKQRAAWKFIQWFTAPEQTAKFSALTYYMPVRRSAFEQHYIQKMMEEHPGLIEVYRQLEYATFEPQMLEWFEFRRYFEEFVLERVFLQTVTPEEALRQAEERMVGILSR